MHQWIFVPRESDEADLSRLLGFHQSFQWPIRRKETVRILQADIFVILDQVDVIGPQAPQGLIDLAGGRFLGAPVELGHQEHLVAITIPQSRAHPPLALAGVIIPTVVQEVYPPVHGAADDAHCFIHVPGKAQVVSTQPDRGDSFARSAQLAIDHSDPTAADYGTGYSRPRVGKWLDQ